MKLLLLVFGIAATATAHTKYELPELRDNHHLPDTVTAPTVRHLR